MKWRMIAFLTAFLLLALSGCNNAPPKEDEPQPFSFSESSQTSPESDTPPAEEIREVETTPESVQTTEPEKQKATTERDTASSEQPQAIPDTKQTAHPADLPNEADKTENHSVVPAKPSVPEQTESKAPKPDIAPPPVTKPPEAEETPSKPEFNIAYWISFAKNYAKSIGLELNSEAVYCWDNPLGAGSHSKYLERDITACLNRYAKDEDITEVWVWAESTGDNTFDLYIGYA